jgi:hypothetical protein
MLRIFCQAAVAIDPSEGSFQPPSGGCKIASSTLRNSVSRGRPKVSATCDSEY